MLGEVLVREQLGVVAWTAYSVVMYKPRGL